MIHPCVLQLHKISALTLKEQFLNPSKRDLYDSCLPMHYTLHTTTYRECETLGKCIHNQFENGIHRGLTNFEFFRLEIIYLSYSDFERRSVPDVQCADQLDQCHQV